MSKASQYWTLMRLNAAGQIKSVVLESAYEFFSQQFPNIVGLDEVLDRPIQAHLSALQSSDTLHDAANLCLRCFISHQIVQVCMSIQEQFGDYYGFTMKDLLPSVLTDDGNVFPHSNCLTMQILQNFRPDLSSLTTWTTRYVRQDSGLNRVLVEHGLYLVTDWAILNDTKPEQLSVILTNFYKLTADEVKQNCILLESYRRVYLPDRLQQRQRKCADPTPEQLEKMSQLMQTKLAKSITPATLLANLQSLAKRLRQYRIYKRGGPLPTVSIDFPREKTKLENIPATAVDPNEQQQSEFLRSYRQLFVDSLDRSLAKVVNDRQQQSKRVEQATRFLTALHLFYCQQMSMTGIAQQLGLRGQDTVTRFLKLKDFRADIRRYMLKHLQSNVLAKAKEYCEPDQLQHLDEQLEAALNEQIDDLMQQEAKRAKTAKNCLSESIFSQRLCRYLDQVSLESPS